MTPDKHGVFQISNSNNTAFLGKKIIVLFIALVWVTAYGTPATKDYKTILVYMRNALQKTGDITILQQYADLLAKTDDLELAAYYYEQLYKHIPSDHDANYNMACILSLLGKHQEALPYYEKAIILKPTHDETHLGYAKALLALGQFEKALPEFEQRMDSWEEFHRYLKYPTLDLAKLSGKKIILLAEWGLGDTLHFVRYAQLLKKLGATVYLQTFGPLIKLLSLCSYIDAVIQQGDRLPQADVRIPLLSLPLVFKTTLETIPAPIPYLYAEPALVNEWQQKIKIDTTLKIGLCWHAKPIYIEEHLYTRRSVPLEQCLAITEVPQVTVYSLQKAYGTDELTTTSHAIKSFDALDEMHGPFMDTAAIIKNLDLVISADTSIVHLAGALGIPVWVLLPYNAEWRWLHERTDTPWYPHTMRLFRQKKPGDWAGVIDDVVKALTAIVDQKKKNETDASMNAVSGCTITA